LASQARLTPQDEPSLAAEPEAVRVRGRTTPAGLARFLAKRLALGALLCLGITLVAFVLTHLVPGDPAAAELGQRAIGDPAAVRAFDVKYGLNKPVPEQYLIYLGHLLHGDLGISEQTQQPVTTNLAQYAPATMELASFAIVLCLVVGLGLGVVAGMTRGSLADQFLRVFSLTGVSMPTFWVALICFYVFFYRLGWFPSGGRLNPGVTPPPQVTGFYTIDSALAGQWSTFWDAVDHLILPGLVLGLYTIGVILRFTRASVLEVLGNDYVRAARAKGLSEWTVIRRHVLRPALLAIITVAGIAFGSLLSGTVLVENIFSWPGIGEYAYTSAINLDLPAIMGVSIVVALIYIILNLVVDVLYTVIDPRISLS
jgi:ABC-type dipeptide/oligopeptide/nickel transport system permease component